MLWIGGADGNERELGMGWAGTGEQMFWPETFHGFELNSLEDTDVKNVKAFAGKDAVGKEVWDVVVKQIGLQE